MLKIPRLPCEDSLSFKRIRARSSIFGGRKYPRRMKHVHLPPPTESVPQAPWMEASPRSAQILHTCLGRCSADQALRPRSPVVMTVAELAAWANVSRNSVRRIVCHFGLREITGHSRHQKYSTIEIMRRVLDVEVQNEAELALLLRPLQGVAWVSRQTGISTSTLAARALDTEAQKPLRAISLFACESGGAAGRARRWVPAEVAAFVRGETVSFGGNLQGPTHRTATVGNAFAALWTTNAGDAR